MTTDAVVAPPNTKVEIVVSYSGLSKTFAVSLHLTVLALLEEALTAFQIQANRHTQSLYNTAGAELVDAQSLEAAGVKNHDHLLLRPSQVKGGTASRHAA